MDAATVEALLQADLADCEFVVNGEGANYDITVVGDVFEGLRPVQRQQRVYAALSDTIASGDIHAGNIRTYTRAQWQQQSQG